MNLKYLSTYFLLGVVASRPILDLLQQVYDEAHYVVRQDGPLMEGINRGLKIINGEDDDQKWQDDLKKLIFDTLRQSKGKRRILLLKALAYIQKAKAGKDPSADAVGEILSDLWKTDIAKDWLGGEENPVVGMIDHALGIEHKESTSPTEEAGTTCSATKQEAVQETDVDGGLSVSDVGQILWRVWKMNVAEDRLGGNRNPVVGTIDNPMGIEHRQESPSEESVTTFSTIQDVTKKANMKGGLSVREVLRDVRKTNVAEDWLGGKHKPVTGMIDHALGIEHQQNEELVTPTEEAVTTPFTVQDVPQKANVEGGLSVSAVRKFLRDLWASNADKDWLSGEDHFFVGMVNLVLGIEHRRSKDLIFVNGE